MFNRRLLALSPGKGFILRLSRNQSQNPASKFFLQLLCRHCGVLQDIMEISRSNHFLILRHLSHNHSCLHGMINIGNPASFPDCSLVCLCRKLCCLPYHICSFHKVCSQLQTTVLFLISSYHNHLLLKRSLR